MTFEDKLKKKIEREAEKSVNRNLYELNEADARVRHSKQGASLLAPLLVECYEAIEMSTDYAKYGHACGHEKLLEKLESFVKDGQE